MTRTVREVRKRGAFGWIFLLLFYGVNAWFAWAFFKGMANVAPLLNDQTMSKAEQTGATIGTVLGFGSILAMWTFAAVITGLLALLTRGKRVLIEDELPPAPKVSFVKMAGPVPPDEFIKRANAKKGFDAVQAVAYVGAAAVALVIGFAAVNWLIN